MRNRSGICMLHQRNRFDWAMLIFCSPYFLDTFLYKRFCCLER
jgi:hypothetical protein